jgi:hypothetical protein
MRLRENDEPVVVRVERATGALAREFTALLSSTAGLERLRGCRRRASGVGVSQC